MKYTCGCGYFTSDWAKREIHKKSCGKPVEDDFIATVIPQPKPEARGLERWM